VGARGPALVTQCMLFKTVGTRAVPDGGDRVANSEPSQVRFHPATRASTGGRRLSTRSIVGERRCVSMATGTVKWFNDSKGYGFIAPDGGGKDLFVHHSNIAGDGFKSLQENARVEYEEREGQKGPEAINVQQTA